MSRAGRPVDVQFAALLNDDELSNELLRLWAEIRNGSAERDLFWRALIAEAAARWLRERCVREPA